MAKNHGFLDGMASIEHLGEIPTDTDGYNVGEGFFTGQSGDPSIRVKYTDLYPCEKNAGMSKPQEKIEALADSIAREGLLAPLVVVQRDGGRYEILSGETRYLAIGLLRDRGIWDPDDMVDARLFDADKLDLPLSREMKEDYARRTANIARDKTEGDYHLEVSEWYDMIEGLRKSGIESLSLPGSDGEEHGIRIAGEKTYDIVAKIVGISATQVKAYHTVAERGTEKLEKALVEDTLSPDTAAKAARELSSRDQDKFAEKAAEKKRETGRRATRGDLEEFKERSQRRKSGTQATEPHTAAEPEPGQERMEYTKDAFYGDMRFLCDCFDNEPHLPITVREHERVLECISTIQEILSPYLGS